MSKHTLALGVLVTVMVLSGCSQVSDRSTGVPQPKEIIDLGMLVSEEMTFTSWGKRLPRELGYEHPNHFKIINWSSGPIDGQNSYYTLFNHGGPHVDAPIHVGFKGGLDNFTVESFAGPLKVFDVSHLPVGPTIKKDTFEGAGLQPGDVVAIYTDYIPPVDDTEYPKVTSLTQEAARFLADVPIRAFATDAWSVDVLPDRQPERRRKTSLLPVHTTFLSRGIPAYEQLTNIGTLLERDAMYFVGQPLNIVGGDGMIVRPLVFVY